MSDRPARKGEAGDDIVIDFHPVTGQPVVRAGAIARFFGKKFYSRGELLSILLGRRRPGEGFHFGDPPPDDWYSRALRALDAELRRQELESPRAPPAVRIGSMPGRAPELRGIEAVVFDVFGTLVQIGQKRRPYLQLQQLLHQHGRQPQPEDSAKMMSSNVGLSGVPGLFGMEIPASLVAALELELYAELPTIRLYEETFTTLRTLRERGYKIGLCSNLAAPYAVPVKLLVPQLDAYAWSFEVGAVKPDPRIYAHICEALDCSPDQILMVGDTLDADYHGPRRFGMQAWHLARDGISKVPQSMTRLDHTLQLLRGA